MQTSHCIQMNQSVYASNQSWPHDTVSTSRFLEMSETIVKISDGRLRGSVEKSIEGYSYKAFKGVPYAKPPIGQLRFKVNNYFSSSYS